MSGTLRTRIYAAIRRIPAGRVTTYGTIAQLLDCDPRQVGYAMAALPDGTAVPWHRVLNVRGGFSTSGATAITQRLRLEREGVRFSQRGLADLAAHGWPRRSTRPAAVRKRSTP